MALGQLVVRLGLDATEFTTGLSRSEVQAQRFAKQMDANLASAGRFIATLGIGAAVGVFVKDTIHAAAALDDLSDATGSSVASLSKLANQAKISGQDFGTLQGLLLKLSAGMAGVEDEGSATSRALKALGVDATDPAEALQQVAVKLNTFADGIGKAALARDLFGKGGPAFLAALKDIAESQEVAATVTAKQAAEAEALEKSIRKLGAEGSIFKDILLGSVVPAINDIIERMKVGTQIAGGFWSMVINNLGTGLVGSFNTVGENIDGINKRIKDITAGEGNESRWASALGVSDNILKRLGQRKEFLQLVQRQEAMAGAAALGYTGDVRDYLATKKPKLEYTGIKPKTGGGGAVDDPAKALLEGRIKEIESLLDQERSILSARESFLSAYYARGDLSIREYYRQRSDTVSEGLAFARSSYTKEISELETYISRDAKTQTARAEAQNKIIDIRKKLQSTEQQAAAEGVRGWFDEQRAAEDYRRTVAGISADVLTMKGDVIGATKLRLQTSQEGLRRSLTVNGDADAIANLNALDKQAIAQAKLSEESRKYSLITDSLGIAHARVDLAAQTGAISEIDALNRKSDLAKQYIESLTRQADAAELASKSLTGIAADEAIAKIAHMRLEIDQLSAQTDLLGDSIRKTFQSDFENAFTSFIDGSKSAKDAFRDFARSVQRELSAMASKQIASQLFGTGGGGSIGSSAASWIASLFGGKSGGISLPLGDAAAAGISGGGFASGTDYARGGWSMVGERGPEAMYVPRGAQIIPNERLNQMRSQRSGTTIIINSTVMPGASRMSADQAAAQSARMATRALQRNG